MDRVRFQFDEHIPHAVAEALRRHRIDVLTTVEAGLLGAPDPQQLQRAHAEGRVLVTHDDDFLRLYQVGQPHSGIAYCHQLARSIGELVGSLLLIHEVLESSELAGRVEFLWLPACHSTAAPSSSAPA